MKYFSWLGIWLAAIFWTVSLPAAPTLHKFEMRDPAAERALLAQGGRLLADYGSYRLYEGASVPAKAETRDDYDSIFLSARTLRTSSSPTKAAVKNSANFTGQRLHLIHFAGPPLPAWRDALLATGVRIVDYLPENAYLVYGDAAALSAVQKLAATAPHVQWEGEYLDDYKIHPLARTVDAAGRARTVGTDRFAIQLVKDDAVNAETAKMVDRLKLAPLERQQVVLGYVNIVGRFRAADLTNLAARPDVISIQPYGARKKLGERQDQIIAGAITNGALLGAGYLSWLESKGFTQEQFDASGFVVDVSDSGIDEGTVKPNHFGLHAGGNIAAASRVVYSTLFATVKNAGSTLRGCDGHGTINAHIVGGYDNFPDFPFADNEGYHYGLGVCPFVRLGGSVVFDPVDFTYPNYTTVQATAYHNGARVSNNSWGGGSGSQEELGVYDVDAQEYDALVRDAEPANSKFPVAGNQEMVIVFAAGNDGIDPNTFNAASNTISSPGTAKNVITVGAAEGVQPFNAGGASDASLVFDFQADNANGIIDFSSRGPCRDGRHKPDLVAPGTHISGGVAQAVASAANPGATGDADACFRADNTLFSTDAGVSGGPTNSAYFPFYPDGQQYYTASSGTSHATPAVTGGCALLRQYFINQGLTPPSAAMTKAFLMNSARYLDGPNANDTLWSDAQGMGELNLGMAFDGAPRVLRDELTADLFTASGQNRVFTGEIADASKPFRVTVAWTDAPGSTTSAVNYNNNLDLTVTAGGKTYLGNVFKGAFSVTGGSADVKDNVESVFLPAGVSGVYTVTVAAKNINSVGVPNAKNQWNQDFALVVYNGENAAGPVLAAAGATLSAEGCGPGNGVVDPGERVTVNLSLANVGGADTTNLVATLLTTNGVVGPSTPQTYGRLTAGGESGSAAFSFSADGVCGGAITAVWQLQDGTKDLGFVSFGFALGQVAFRTEFSSDFTGGIPTDWGNVSSGDESDWLATTDGSGGVAAYARDAGAQGEADLISPWIDIEGLAPQLTFQHEYGLEAPTGPVAYDGGVLEIKIGTNDFADILTAGGSFATNGYNKTISAYGGNGLMGRQAWSGTSGGYVTTVVNLPAAALHQFVRFKWACGTDQFNDHKYLPTPSGWWISNVAVTEQIPSCCQSPAPVSPTILSPTDGAQTSVATNIISGSGTPGDAVQIFDNGAALAVLTVDTNGLFQGAIALAYGPNVLTAHQAAANEGDSAAVTITLRPAAPTLSVAATSGEPALVAGQGAPGASVTVYDDGTFVANLTVDETGRFSGELELPFGAQTLTATETIEGMTSDTSANASVTVVDIPTPTITFPTNGFVINNPALTIRGAATPGAIVTIYDSGAELGTALAGKTGIFALAGKYANGAHVFTAAQTSDGILGGVTPGVNVTVQLVPIITAQPQDFKGFLGGSAVFTAAAYGAPPLTYAWQHAGANVPGAARPALTLAALTARSAGTYRLTVRNAYGTALSDMVTLTVVTNPFPGRIGAYAGLYRETPPRFESSGLLTLNLTALGRFTARLTGGGGAYSFSGGLNADGYGQFTVARGARLAPWTVTLNLGLTDLGAPLTGTVTDGNWVAPVQANRAVFTTAHPCPERGSYTARFGDGYGTVTVGATGYVTLRGLLPDNTAVAPAAVSVSTNGLWPLYAPLYGKAGSLSGWIQFTNGVATNFGGSVLWVRTNMFTSTLLFSGSTFVPRSPFLGLTNLEITVAGGDLPEVMSNNVALLRTGAFKPLDTTIPGLSLAVNPLTGLLTGRFSNPNTRTPETLRGVVFQGATNGGGFFRDVNGSGSFSVTPAGH
ncbi:MAG TPA: S8 family serine peptidase [Verrucomicrobiae bacterium]|nr:S8 family serine peptidase [Verrucomicrobiae bacterium]